jgi:probable F420-dependent oxidoreductase
MEIGPIGIWAGQFRTGARGEAAEAFVELAELGYDALWVPGGGTSEILDVAADLLATAPRMVFATGILNIWMHDPQDVAAQHAAIERAFPDRLLLGLGVSHRAMIEASGERTYTRPYSMMVEYLDALDRAAPPVPQGERVLAALGPRMLELARDRTAGAHPYLVPPEHTHVARLALGPGPLLAPELKAVLETDPVVAREIARAHLARYLNSPNYANNLLRLGFSEQDMADGGSDQLVDKLVVWGDPGAIRARLDEHRAAGADHVCVQVLASDPALFPRAAWRELAPALLD